MMTSSHFKGRFLPPFFKIYLYKKYLLLLLIFLAIVSCSQDVNQKKIAVSFRQFLNNLEKEDINQIENFLPFLAKMSPEKQNTVLKPFRALINLDYKLEISKISDEVYYLHIKTEDPDSIWSGITLPYHKNTEGYWVMASEINKVQTFDIVPAKN